MKKAENSSEKHSMLPKWIIWGFIILGFIGFLDTSYLTVSHYTGADVNCSIVEGCNEVLSSKYSEIFGIPLSLLGLFYYLFILIGALYYLDTKNPKVLKLLTGAVTFGFLFSGWLVYLQVFVIESICQYCMVSAINSVFLFILGLFTIKYWSK